MGHTEMSLINQMLQDLAQRQAPAADTLDHIAPVSVRARRKPIPAWVWIALLGIISANALAWLWLHNRAAKPQTVATPIPGNTAKPPLRAVSVPIAAMAPLAPAPKPAETVAVPVPPSATFALTPSLTLTLGAAKPSINLPPEKLANPVEATATAPASISKQVKPLTTAQLAENEYRKALALAQQGRINEGMEGFAQTLALDPHHHAARLTLVGLLIDNKRMAEAERRLQEGLTLDIEQTDLAMILARLQVERGNVNDGIATLEHSLPYAIEQADYQAFLATLLQRAGRPRQAIEHYIIALKKSPQSGVWWMGLGISLKADNQPDKAREAFNRAKATNSLTPDLLAYVNQQLS